MPLKHKKQTHHRDPSAAYITDDAAYSEAPLPAPPPPTRTNDELNHAVLRRHHPAITHILSTAPFATVYAFSQHTSQWEKANCDGTLFVCALAPAPAQPDRFALVILNRRELKNFYLELLSPAAVEYAEPFVVLEDDVAGVAWGLFIAAEEGESTAGMRELNVGVIMDCAQRAEESRVAAQAGARQVDGAWEGGDGLETHAFQQRQGVHSAQEQFQQPWQQQSQQQEQTLPPGFSQMNGGGGGGDVLGSLFARAKASQAYH